jgi:NAD-dependent deacetylase
MENTEKLTDLLLNSEYCVVLTGAGISTYSGIPDFRGSGGLYARFDAEKIFSLNYFNQNPAYFYSVAEDFIYNLEDRKPSFPHRLLAELESRRIVKAVITQNIDMLHQKAGSRNVIEIHGSPASHTCMGCRKKYGYAEIASKVCRKDIPPYCPRCGGLIKPDITFFGEMLDTAALEAAVRESAKADLLIVVGSSLVVQPAASLPFYSLKKKGKLVIVNNMETPLDRYAELKYPDIGDTFGRLSADLGEDEKG